MRAEYDTVFRTLVNDCPKLLIPFINEVFGEHYPDGTPIQFHPNEHFIRQKDGKTQERITDTCFEVLDTIPKKYHLECQSTSDSSMLIRMFEYGAQIALNQGELKKNVLTVDFPHSAILYLRCSGTTPDKIRVIIRSPAGELHYDVAVVKIHNYSLKEIFQKKLLFLIPFYIFTHERRFAVYNKQEQQRNILLKEYEYIRDELEKMSIIGEIDEYTKRTLMEMSGKVLEYLAKDYAQVQKGVTSIMVGKVLDYEAKTILNQGISQGKRETYLDLLRKGIISIAEVANGLLITEQEVKEMLKQ